MMIRKGRFAVWNNEEYELISYQRQYYLVSEDEAKLEQGFTTLQSKKGFFVRLITAFELEDAYEIFPYAMISGYRFQVEGYNEDMQKVVLVTNNPFVQKKVDVRPYGKSEYIIEIPFKEVEVLEDRLPILGFESILQ